MIDGWVFHGRTHCGKPTSSHITLCCNDPKCQACHKCPLCMGLGAWIESKPFRWMSEPYMEPAPCPRCGKKGARPDFAGWGAVP